MRTVFFVKAVLCMKAAISTACLYPAYLENALEQIASRGVRHAEIFVNTDSEMKPPILNILRSTVTRTGIKITSVHPYTCGIEPMMFFTDYPRRLDDIIDYYRRFFSFMNEFGAKVFVFHGNKPQNHIDERTEFERYAMLAEAGDEFGITVAQENVSRCTSGKLDYLTRMSDYLGSRAAFVLDTKQAIRAGEDSIEVLRALGRKVVHVHFSDSVKNGRDCVMYKQGDYDNYTFFTMLRDMEFEGRIVLELYKDAYRDADELTANYRLLSDSLRDNY